MDKGDSQTILWNRTGIFEWKRRLRTNVGKEMLVNGKKYTKSYLKYEDIKDGITVHFIMSDKANFKRGTKPSDLPPSVSEKGKTKLYISNKQ